MKSPYQNNLKTPKNINLKQRKKKLNFFKSAFETQKQIETPRLWRTMIFMQKIRIFKEIRMWDFVFGFMEKKNSNLAEIS